MTMVRDYSSKRIFLIATIASLGVSALIGIVVFLFGDFGDTEFKLLATTLSIGGYGLTGLCCSVIFERRRFTLLAASGMIVSVLGFLFTLAVIWRAIGFQESWRTLLIFVILAVSVAHTCLLLLIEAENALVNYSLWATVLVIGIVSVMLIVLVFDAPEVDELYFRLLGVFAILDVLGTIVTPVLNRVYSMQG